MYAIKDVNEMVKSEFITTIGTVFEHSPWVAEKSWKHHPFESLEQLHADMVHEMYQADPSLQLSLLKAHPDLGTKLAISQASKQEQQGAGLSSLSEEEYFTFTTFNENYVEKFNFPFIMAVKGQSKETILDQMKERQYHHYESEMITALNEVSKIAKFRLIDMIFDEQSERTIG